MNSRVKRDWLAGHSIFSRRKIQTEVQVRTEISAVCQSESLSNFLNINFNLILSFIQCFI